MLGSEDEVIGHLFSASMPPDDLKEVCASFLELIVGEIDHYETLKRRLREDTSITYSTMTGSLVPEPNGTASHTISMVIALPGGKVRLESGNGRYAKL